MITCFTKKGFLERDFEQKSNLYNNEQTNKIFIVLIYSLTILKKSRNKSSFFTSVHNSHFTRSTPKYAPASQFTTVTRKSRGAATTRFSQFLVLHEIEISLPA